MKHANISIFVPHLGCPNDCSFCNQKHITGTAAQPTEKDIDEAIITARSSANYDPKNTEIAFFGGSFTAIDKEYMLMLLRSGGRYVDDGSVKGIRISTRPDCIDEEVLDILKEYGVTSIELGAQSMDDRVLRLNDRGHTSADVLSASELIKSRGFELGLQMMTGLYGDSDEGAVVTAEKIIDILPATVRIYPTVVLENTRLAELYRNGVYEPQDLYNAVKLCARLSDMFNKADIKVIRTGLHSIDKGAFVAGPWHPAFSELCDSELIFTRILSECKKGSTYEIYINPADISKAVGQKRANVDRLIKAGYNIRFIQDSKIQRNTIRCKEVN